MCHCAHIEARLGPARVLAAAMVLAWCGLAAGQESRPATTPASEPASRPASTPANEPASSPAAPSTSGPAEGEEPAVHTPLPPYNPAINTAPENDNPLWQMFSSILVILLLGGAALFVIKKVLPRLGIAPASAAAAPGPRERMKVIDTLRLGPQRQVHLLEVEGRRYLVGHTATNITFLAEVPPAVPPKEESK